MTGATALEQASMQVPLLDLKMQFVTIEGEIRESIDRVLESQHSRRP